MQCTFSRMPGCQREVVEKGKQKFIELTVDNQILALMSIINLLRAGRAGGVDLLTIGGKS